MHLTALTKETYFRRFWFGHLFFNSKLKIEREKIDKLTWYLGKCLESITNVTTKKIRKAQKIYTKKYKWCMVGKILTYMGDLF